MKVKTVTLKVEIPSPEAIASGLVAEEDASYVMAKERTNAARHELASAERRLSDAGARVDRVRADVPAGRATPRDLETALVDQKKAALVIDQYRARVGQMEREETRALEEARAAVRRAGEDRIKVLQDAAKRIAPVLEALKAAELALDRKVPNLPAVRWPASVVDDAAATPHNPLPPLTWR